MVVTFLYSLAGGILAVLALGRVEQIAWRFLRLMGLLAFAISCVIGVWRFRQEGATEAAAAGWSFTLGLVHSAAAVVFVFLSPLHKRVPAILRTVCGLGGLAGLSSACISVSLSLSIESNLPAVRGVYVVLSQALGGLLLGSVTVAWLLGHAYLTATKMTIAPLRRFSRMLSWAIVTRILFMLVSVATAWLATHNDSVPIMTHLANSWLIVLLRVGVGLAAVGVFAYMVGDCVRRRATQSATGLLYFGSIFVYVGELASQQLIAEYGWPL